MPAEINNCVPGLITTIELPLRRTLQLNNTHMQTPDFTIVNRHIHSLSEL